MGRPLETLDREEAATENRSMLTHTGVVLGLAFVLRVLAVFSVVKFEPAAVLFKNGLEMGLLAKSLLGGHGLASPFGPETGPTAFIAPVYPILVAGVFRVFGVYSNASAVVMMILHLAANLATIWLLMYLARKYFDERVALIAGLFWACSPPLMFLPTIFWETSFSICLLLGLVALALRVRERGGFGLWLALGAYGGFAALVNPALLLTVIAVICAVVCLGRERVKLQWIGLGALMFMLVFCAWPIRNARVFHAFIPLRTTVGFELWMGNHEGATGYLQEQLFPTYNRDELDAYNRDGELAYTNGKTALAKSYIEAHPGTFLAMSVRRFFRFWLGRGTEHGSPLFAVQSVMTSAFGFAGLWMLFRRRWRRELAWVVAMPLVFFPVPYYMTHAEFRYRLVIDPILTLLSGYGVVELVKRSSGRNRRPGQVVASGNDAS